jgi:quercetin 2,3-dioxygenase
MRTERMVTGDMSVELIPSEQRFSTDIGWLQSKHSFSFGAHYDPKHVGHGLLLVSNDDVVAAGTGFDTHPHRDMEIVTWVLSGRLEHQDSEGNRGELYPGLAQRMTAGTGIWHSEKNPSKSEDVHFVQMWVLPDTERVRPSYEQLDINSELSKGGLVPVASGRGDEAAISLRQRGAVLLAGRLQAGQTVTLPADRFVHLYVPRGGVTMKGGELLLTGDAARLTEAGPIDIVAGAEGAEVLVWSMAA